MAANGSASQAIADANALKQRFSNDLLASMGLLQVYIGHKLALFHHMNEAGHPLSPKELASRAGLQERYVREWLCTCAAYGFLQHQPEQKEENKNQVACPLDLGMFSLSPGAAIAFLDKDSPAYAAAYSLAGPSLGQIMPQLLKAFREGGGVPFEAYGEDFLELIADSNRASFKYELASQWMPALGDSLKAKLDNGGVIADVGCGMGHSLVALAKAFPKARVIGLDLDEASVAGAKKRIAEAGLEGQVEVHQAFAHEAREKVAALKDGADLITLFECLHDMHNQVEVLSSVRELAKEKEGVLLVADEKVGDTLQDALPENPNEMPAADVHPTNFLARLHYGFSTVHCLPQAMVYPNSSCTGTCMRPYQLKKFAQAAGWAGIEAVHESDKWQFYRFLWQA